MSDRITICSEKRLRELLQIEQRVEKLEAVAEAARKTMKDVAYVDVGNQMKLGLALQALDAEAQ